MNRRIYRHRDTLNALLIGGGGMLGLQIASHLVSRRVHTVVHGGRNRQNFQNTIAHLQKINAKYVHGMWAPITNHQKFYRKITQWFPVDILIFLYGPYLTAPISCTDYKQWDNLSSSNFVLPSALISTNFEYLQHATYGRVIGFAPDYRTEMVGYTQIAAYAAAKWALACTIRSAAAQNTNNNTKYYLVAPGYIRQSSQNNNPHTHCIPDVANGVVSLLDTAVIFKDGSTIALDTLMQKL